MAIFDISLSQTSPCPETSAHENHIIMRDFCFRQNDSHKLQKWVVDSDVLFRRVRLLVIREQMLKIVTDFSLLPSTSALGLLIDEASSCQAQRDFRKEIMEEMDF